MVTRGAIVALSIVFEVVPTVYLHFSLPRHILWHLRSVTAISVVPSVVCNLTCEISPDDAFDPTFAAAYITPPELDMTSSPGAMGELCGGGKRITQLWAEIETRRTERKLRPKETYGCVGLCISMWSRHLSTHCLPKDT